MVQNLPSSLLQVILLYLGSSYSKLMPTFKQQKSEEFKNSKGISHFYHTHFKKPVNGV